MEVVINGDLVRAADGHGFRAIAMGAKGVREHARLFEVKNLQNVVNAAAVWQIASVLVAQKHLADISKITDYSFGKCWRRSSEVPGIPSMEQCMGYY
jgi:hypothetical protein